MELNKIIFKGKTKKGNEIKIQNLQKTDLRDVLTYINKISREKTYIRFQGEQLTLDEEKRYIDEFLKKVAEKKAIKLLAYHKKNLIGIADIILDEKTSSHVGKFGITIAKEYRGEGVGKLLMNLIISQAKKTMPNLKIIELTVFGNNGIACSLYEKIGFVRYGVLPKGIHHKNSYINHIFMYKNV